MTRSWWGWRSPFVETWLFLGLLVGAVLYACYVVEGRSVRWVGLVAWYVSWVVWIPLGRRVFAAVRRRPLDRPGWQPRGLAYAAASFVLVGALLLFRALVEWSLHRLAGGGHGLFQLHAVLVQSIVYDLFVFWGIVALSHAADYQARYAERELAAARVRSQLASARLRFLRAQLHPHFLFNSLNLISGLLHEDPDKADEMLADLGELLRLSLEEGDHHEVALAKELAFLERYLQIARVRFGPRLAVVIDAEPGALEARVPYLLLQPLVENAIRHAAAERGRPTSIEVRARRHDGRLRVEVLDDGPGIDRQALARSRGIGIANTRARLEQLYGAAHRFDLSDRPAGGARALVEIPFSRSPRPAPDLHSAAPSTPPQDPIQETATP